MDEFTARHRHFAALLGGPMLWQGVLQQYQRDKYRLRWHETAEDGRRVHRSYTVSPEELPIVQELMKELGGIRQTMREQCRQAKEYVRIYREERRLGWEQARGGRCSKRDVVRYYDGFVRKVREIKPVLRQATLTMVQPRRRGRPRKRPVTVYFFNRTGNSSCDVDLLPVNGLFEKESIGLLASVSWRCI